MQLLIPLKILFFPLSQQKGKQPCPPLHHSNVMHNNKSNTKHST